MKIPKPSKSFDELLEIARKSDSWERMAAAKPQKRMRIRSLRS